MSFKNLLDLRKKLAPQVVVVEKVIIQPRSFKTEVLKVLGVMVVVTALVWGISKADDLNLPKISSQLHSKSFSAIGLVSDIANTTLSIDNAKGSDNSGTTYIFDTTNVKKIETKDYSPLTLSDIQVGDKIIVQGIFNDGNNIEIRRIISFGGGTTTPKVEVATSTQPNLEKDLNGQAATTTNATTSDSTTTDATQTTFDSQNSTGQATTPSIIDSIINTATTTFQNIVDAVVGTTTSTSTPAEASSTPANLPEEDLKGQAPTSTTSDATATSEVTPPASDASSTP